MRLEWLEEQRGKDAKAWLRARFKRIWMVALATGTVAFMMVQYDDQLREILSFVISVIK